MKSIVLTISTVSFFLLLSLFHHWEPSSETWGYWTFARILAETGSFIIPDRSPAYVTYLLLFRWLPFPASLITEYLVTTGITVTSLIFFFRPLLGIGMATFAAILWIPFLQIAEPPTQKLALALSLFAVILRNKRPSPFRLSASYALLILCYLLRSTYQFLLLLFLLWDGVRLVHRFRHAGLPSIAKRLLSDPGSACAGKQTRMTRNTLVSCFKYTWPLLLVLSFYLLVLLRQSPHPWNTIYFSTTQWFPHDGKHFSILQVYNARYALETYGTINNQDFYFTNQEVFRGAKSSREAFFANPVFVLRILVHQLVDGIFEMTRLTLGYAAIVTLSGDYTMYIQSVFVLLLGAVFYGAFRGAPTSSTRVLVIGNILMVFLSMVILPHWRYMLPFIPVFLLAVVWYAKQLGGLAYLRKSNTIKTKVFACCFTACLIIVFSNGIVLWKDLLLHAFHDTLRDDLRILRYRPDEKYGSVVASHQQLQTLTRSCRGIVLLEHMFLAGFTDVPFSRIHDVFELPPFGQYDGSDSSLLTPDRINCLFLSRELSQEIGFGTNFQIRYDRYLAPYKYALLQIGAQIYPVESSGEVIVAP